MVATYPPSDVGVAAAGRAGPTSTPVALGAPTRPRRAGAATGPLGVPRGGRRPCYGAPLVADAALSSRMNPETTRSARPRRTGATDRSCDCASSRDCPFRIISEFPTASWGPASRAGASALGAASGFRTLDTLDCRPTIRSPGPHRRCIAASIAPPGGTTGEPWGRGVMGFEAVSRVRRGERRRGSVTVDRPAPRRSDDRLAPSPATGPVGRQTVGPVPTHDSSSGSLMS